MDPDRLIKKRMGIKRGDSLPMKSWRHDKRREDIYKIWAELGYTRGAEVGVASGRNARTMFKTIPGLHLILVDPWKAYFRYSQELCDKRYAGAMKILEPYDKTVMRMPTLEAAPQVPDGSLDFVYIDGDHRFDAVMLDIILWAPKVREGGIVAGHDYYEFYQAGVVSAVRSYVQAHAISPWYITWEKEASWFWVQREKHGN